MDELETYKQQREQIELALVDDPENAELLKLRQDLTELIDLMAMAAGGPGAGGGGKGEASSSSRADKKRRGGAAAVAAAAPPDAAGRSPVAAANAAGVHTSPKAASGPQQGQSPVGASPAREWKVGEKCKARWAQDGKFYDALITAASDAGVYSVTFTEYGDVALVRAHDLRSPHGATASSTGHKRRTSEEDRAAADAAVSADPAGSGAASGAADQQKAKKKKKTTGKSEVVEKQNAWLNFAKKGPKAPHGKKSSLLSKRSMFSTPDNPNAKVGVIGSGAGMTSFVQRGKHIFGSNPQ